jgi:two-component system response regulator FlrC
MEDIRPKLADIEREHILSTLALCEGNRTHAAEMLGISLRCLRNKLHRYFEDGFGVPEPKVGIGHAAPSIQVRRVRG